MLDLKFVRANFDGVREMLQKRHNDLDLDMFERLDQERREGLTLLEDLRCRRNQVSEEIAAMKKRREDATDRIEQMREVSTRIKEKEKALTSIMEDLDRLLMVIPNMPLPSVPVGRDERDNPVVRTWGEAGGTAFEPKAHWDIGEALGILDLPCAAKISGSRFALYRGAGARLERALINFMLDVHTQEHGYTEILPPFLVNSASMTGTGQLPKFAEDLFRIQDWDLYLIPTAEVPVTNIHREEILDAEELPRRYVAYTPCFRSEAGSHGKDTRGLIRQHQFNKVELVKFTRPEESEEELERLTRDAEDILQRLELPYRVVTLCTGDLGFSAAKTYDIEVWLPGQGLYREISSCSTFTDFQARRANIRFKTRGQKGTTLVHTLNGSGLAVGRTFVAILENHQQADGTVRIPDVLKSYMGGRSHLSADEGHVESIQR
ncbi:serine--tRNA ligase [Desulfatiglans anilini]|uniref:serine--tRNA ligase n=1 Tax=Desulfatiglans anilini TaxID=90728 RepID=UPI00041D3D42|nr:serine--tRNA ligase [Desulfatiglans anilini]